MLGEVNPEELKTIALDPKTRKIFRVSLPETDEEVDEIKQVILYHLHL